MLRSSLSIFVGGSSAGLLAVASEKASPLESAVAVLITASAIAVADMIARKKRMHEHEDNVSREHEITRRQISKLFALSRHSAGKTNRKRTDQPRNKTHG